MICQHLNREQKAVAHASEEVKTSLDNPLELKLKLARPPTAAALTESLTPRTDASQKHFS